MTLSLRLMLDWLSKLIWIVVNIKKNLSRGSELDENLDLQSNPYHADWSDLELCNGWLAYISVCVQSENYEVQQLTLLQVLQNYY